MRKSKSVRTKYASQHETTSVDKAVKQEKEDEVKSGDGASVGDQSGYFVEKGKRQELRNELDEAGGDLAIVCPLVDGRLKDIAAK